MSASTRPCWICGSESNIWSHVAARTCDACQANPVERLGTAGFTISTGEKHPYRTVDVQAPAHKAPSIRLTFGPEGFGTMFTKLFKKELQVGQQQFDDEVYLQRADEGDLTVLQGYEVGELMKTLVKTCTVDVENAKATALVMDREAKLEEVALLTASLLHAIRLRQNG